MNSQDNTVYLNLYHSFLESKVFHGAGLFKTAKEAALNSTPKCGFMPGITWLGTAEIDLDNLMKVKVDSKTKK